MMKDLLGPFTQLLLPASWWATVGRKPEETPPIEQAREPVRAQPRGWGNGTETRPPCSCMMMPKGWSWTAEGETANPRDARASFRLWTPAGGGW